MNTAISFIEIILIFTSPLTLPIMAGLIIEKIN